MGATIVHKRLKGADEPGTLKIISDSNLNKAIKRNAVKSKTYGLNDALIKKIKNESNVICKKPSKAKTVLNIIKNTTTVLYHISVVLMVVVFLIALSR